MYAKHLTMAWRCANTNTTKYSAPTSSYLEQTKQNHHFM